MGTWNSYTFRENLVADWRMQRDEPGPCVGGYRGGGGNLDSSGGGGGDLGSDGGSPGDLGSKGSGGDICGVGGGGGGCSSRNENDRDDDQGDHKADAVTKSSRKKRQGDTTSSSNKSHTLEQTHRLNKKGKKGKGHNKGKGRSGDGSGSANDHSQKNSPKRNRQLKITEMTIEQLVVELVQRLFVDTEFRYVPKAYREVYRHHEDYDTFQKVVSLSPKKYINSPPLPQFIL